ncbi:MAG: tetratricopeptide repeat protein [Thermoanaerobaculales bacterium]|nr:tetratricopeptide repeat protein [Thermoanaerobaculales bacterium]
MKKPGSRFCAVIAAGVLIIAVTLPAGADYNKGVEAYRARDYSTAVKEFQAVVQQSPDHAGSHYMLGLSLRGAKQTSKALASLRKATELDPANASFAIALGQTLVKAKQYNDAYLTLKKVRYGNLDARTKATYAPAFGMAAIKAGFPGEAIPVLEAQGKASPRDANLFYTLGYAYSTEGESAKAFTAFKKAFELNPKDNKNATSAVKAAISAGRRTSSATQKRAFYTQGAAIAEILAESTPTFDNLLLAGETWLGGKQYSKALGWFDKAVAKQSQNALVRFYRAQCHTSLNQYDAATKELQSALKIGVSGKLRTQVYNQMGFVYDKTKQYDKAISAYRNSGNTAMVTKVEKKKETAAENAAAEAALRDYERKLRALEAQINELEAIGEMEEAAELRRHLEGLRNQ